MKYVAYYRVSTDKQGQSGLGLEAQRTTVLSYIKHNGNELVAEFIEVESGGRDKRPELQKAIQTAKENKATLVIAKLDRLSRNVSFISKLLDTKVKFICCDMPDATELTIHIFAAIAQWEQKRISDRTKEGLAAKKFREPEWKAGKNNFTDEGREKAFKKIREEAMTDKSNRHAFHFIKPLKEKGLSYQKIADELNKEGYKTRRGNPFTAMQTYNIWKRFENSK